jgi:hypothetical protein
MKGFGELNLLHSARMVIILDTLRFLEITGFFPISTLKIALDCM